MFRNPEFYRMGFKEKYKIPIHIFFNFRSVEFNRIT